MSAPTGDPPNSSADDNAYAVGRPIAHSLERDVVPFEAPIGDVDRPDLMSSPAEPTRSLGEFFCTVYTFPLRPRAAPRWLLLTIGLAPALAIPAYVIDRTGSWFIGGLAMLPLVACVFWSVTYGPALFFCITEATAAGANTIEEWPGEDWPEWTDRVVQLGYTFCASSALSIAMMNAAGFGAISAYPARDWTFLTPSSIAFWIAAASLVYILFPVVLMSSLQSESRWSPLTWQVLRSLVAKETAWLWILFWLAGLPLVALVCGQFFFTRRGWFAITGAGLGGLLAAELMIYARLFGRLGWEISERLPGEPQPAEETSADASQEDAGDEAPESALAVKDSKRAATTDADEGAKPESR